jgi:hypothetical protein
MYFLSGLDSGYANASGVARMMKLNGLSRRNGQVSLATAKELMSEGH